MLAILIDRIPLDSEKKAHKVLHICNQFKLKDQGTHIASCSCTVVNTWCLTCMCVLLVAQSVCRVLATKALKTARMGTALEWAVGSKVSIRSCFCLHFEFGLVH